MRPPNAHRSLKLGLAAITTGLSILAGLVIPFSTALAVTCSGSGCNNTSPQTTGCSAGAVNKKTATVVNSQWPYDDLAKLELRYSPTCKTVWSRVTILDDDHGAFTAHEWTTRANSGGPAYTVEDTDSGLWGGDIAYSPQIYLPASSTDAYSAKACVSISNGTVAAGQACTSYWTGV